MHMINCYSNVFWNVCILNKSNLKEIIKIKLKFICVIAVLRWRWSGIRENQTVYFNGPIRSVRVRDDDGDDRGRDHNPHIHHSCVHHHSK